MKQSPLLARIKQIYPDISEKQLFAWILCGEIKVNGATVRSPREPVPADAVIEHRLRRPFVSRGGEKLEGVLERWGVQVAGLAYIDAGASTGGFTDCLLQRGARAVIAVERGFNQLHYRLRQDPRVTLLERTNVMDLSPQMLPFPADGGVADLSLRSLRRAASHLLSLLSGGYLIALVKPQYERGSRGGGSAGVLRDRGQILRILQELMSDLSGEGLSVTRAAPSPILGTKGNPEFFFQISGSRSARRQLGNRPEASEALEELVAEAFSR